MDIKPKHVAKLFVKIKYPVQYYSCVKTVNTIYINIQLIRESCVRYPQILNIVYSAHINATAVAIVAVIIIIIIIIIISNIITHNNKNSNDEDNIQSKPIRYLNCIQIFVFVSFFAAADNGRQRVELRGIR
jgi:quinol-cytochrome oxidoreductase complex cytochrome b subunit